MSIPRVSGSAVRQAGLHATHAAQEAKPWVGRLARVGYAAKGVIYSIIGVLALQAALGRGGGASDPQDALGVILRQPFGQLLLGIVAAGLMGYALWRLVEAILGPEEQAGEMRGIVKRIGYGVSSVLHAGLALTAARMAMGSRGNSHASTQDWTARFLAHPAGPSLVGAAGAVILGVGVYALVLAYNAKFCRKLNLAEMSPTEQTWARRIGRIGLTARGVVFGIIGTFLIVAAFQHDPNEARGLAGALKVLASQPYGPWLLGAVAAGFIAYGLFLFVQARYRRIAPA